MFAVIRQGGKQYIIEPGQELKVEKIDVEVGETIALEDVLLVSDTELKFGAPKLTGAKITATVLAHGQGDKVTGVKFHNKVRYRRTFGHRQLFTKIKIEQITV